MVLNVKKKVVMVLLILALVPGISAEPVEAIGLDDLTDSYNWFMETIGLKESDRYTNTTVHEYNELDSWGFSTSPDSDNIIYKVRYEGIDSGQWFVGKYYYGQNAEKWVEFNVSYKKNLLDLSDMSTFNEEFTMVVETSEGKTETYTFSQKLSLTNTFTGRAFEVRYTVPLNKSEEDQATITGLACFMDSGDYPGSPGQQINASTLEYHPIVKFKGYSNKYINTLKYETASFEYYQESKSETKEIANLEWWGLMEWAGIFKDVTSGIMGIFLQLFWLFKLIFIDNLYLTLMIFEGFVLADALKSRSLIGWWKRVINNHVKLFNFLMDMVRTFVDVVAWIVMAIANALRLLKPFG